MDRWSSALQVHARSRSWVDGSGKRGSSAWLGRLTISFAPRQLPRSHPFLTGARRPVGDVAIEVPIHSAGIVGKPGQRAGNVDYESWATVLNINTMGPLRVTETFIDHLARGERKLAVTITSGMGSVTDNIRRLDCLSQFQTMRIGPRWYLARK